MEHSGEELADGFLVSFDRTRNPCLISIVLGIAERVNSLLDNRGPVLEGFVYDGASGFVNVARLLEIEILEFVGDRLVRLRRACSQRYDCHYVDDRRCTR